MKFLVRFFISLFVFLLTGYGQMYAHASQDTMRHAAAQNLSESKHSALADIVNRRDINVKADLSALTKVNDKVDTSDNEDEDEKFISLKKLTAYSNFLTAVINTHTPSHLYHTAQKSLTNFKLFYNFSSQRWYILFRVIRI